MSILDGMAIAPSIRDRILAKPGYVQTVIRALMVKAALEDSSPNWDEYGEAALADWNENIYPAAAELGMSEEEAGQEILTRLRKQDVWGKILRGDSC